MVICPICNQKVGIFETKIKLPNGNVTHKECYELEEKKKSEMKKIARKKKKSPKELENYYKKSLDSLQKGKENQAEFYIRKIIESEPSDIDLLRRIPELILEIGYDDFENDVEFCFERMKKLEPNNHEIWVSYIDYLYNNYSTSEALKLKEINTALIKFPKSEKLIERKCNILIENGEDGLEVLKLLRLLKEIYPNNSSIQDLKEEAIEILMDNEEDDEPEVLRLIEEI